MKQDFKEYLQILVDTSQIVIDRHKGSTHPRFLGKKYPVDYGFLEGTTTIDSSGIDIWLGSSNKREVVGVLCTVDLLKRDTEVKILIGCSDEEIQQVFEFVNTNDMRAIQIIF
jgi:inorganic pyrophosphatase